MDRYKKVATSIRKSEELNHQLKLKFEHGASVGSIIPRINFFKVLLK